MFFSRNFTHSPAGLPRSLQERPRVFSAQMCRVVMILVAIPAMLLAFAADADAQAFSVSVFRPWPGYAMGDGRFVTGDFNGDGKTDLVHPVADNQYANIWLSNGDGTFTIKQFSPWPGYAMGDGYFLAGDFNGDGKADLAHIVTDNQYANIWLSNGDGTFTIKQFSPWGGYAMGDGYFIAGDFNGDGKTDLIHIVADSQYANIWLSNGDGTFTVKQFSPWSGYAMGDGYFLAGDFNGDGKTDLVHIVTDSQYANIWLSNGDGTFTVKQFSPWNGYAMGDGRFLVGDFNGDGKADLVHPVGDNQYANIWLSNGDGTFSIKQFSPWGGYAMGDGYFLAVDLNKDGKTDLVHLVSGSDYVNLWISNGDGSFGVQQFSPWNGYAIGAGYFLSGDVNGDGKGDLVHIVTNGDYANIWTALLPGIIEFSQDGIEVTQAVQDMAHTVPLVAGRQTWVRVYLSANSFGPVTVASGVLSARNLTTNVITTVNSASPVVVDPAQNSQLRQKRESINLSLNFPLPPGLTDAGGEEFTLTSLTSTTGLTLTCSDCVPNRRSVSFVASAPMRVRIVGLQYTTGTPPATFSPSGVDFALLQSWLLRAYPIPQLFSTQTTITANSAWPFSCTQANAQLSALRATEVGGGGVDARTHYIGLVANGGGYMRGCAAVPATPDPTAVGSAPTGNPAGPGPVPVNVAGDTDGSFGDWYGGHELDHTFGRNHPGFCNGNSASDPNFPFPNGQISTNDGAFTGLDVGDPNNAIPSTVLPGASRFDIMTYCNQPQWLSSYTYAGTLARLNAEDPSGGGPPARGPGQQQKRFVTNTGIVFEANCLCPIVEPNRKSAPELIVGHREPPIPVIERELAPLPPRPGAERPQPPAPAGYRMEPKPAMPGPPGVQRAVIFPNQTAAPLFNERSQVELKEGPFVNIVATVNLTKNTGKILYANHVQKALVRTVVIERRAILRALGQKDKVLGEYPVWLRLDSDTRSGEDQMALIDEPIPALQHTAAIELLLNGKLLDRLLVPKKVPAVHDLKVVEFRERIAVLQWKASHADHKRLTYLVQSSSDGGKTWTTAAIGLLEPRFEIRMEQANGRLPDRARVIANDGYNDSAPAVVSLSPQKQ